MTARDDVLDRIGRALLGRRQVVDVPRDYRRASPASVDLLVDRLRDYRATVHVVDASQVVATLARCATGSVLLPKGFPREWSPSSAVPDTGQPPRELEQVQTVVTTCAVAIAQTGTIVLDAGPGQGRRALTLVPDHHVVVLREEHVVGSVPEALALLDPRSPQTWISGPSATSDIELQRVEGVHGPRRLEVVVVRAVDTAPGHPTPTSSAQPILPSSTRGET